MTIDPLTAVVIEPRQTATHCIIWLHGLGADGHDFEDIVPELGLSDLNIRFVFPHAPVRPVTINGGQRMRAWYDIVSLEMGEPQDIQGIQASHDLILELIQNQIEQQIIESNIILAGFSQGGAIALYTGLRYTKKLAGIVALSTYLPLADTLINGATADTTESVNCLSIFMAHGTDDNVIPIDYGQWSKNKLKQFGCKVTWHEYAMAHSLCMEEIRDIALFVRSVF